MSLYEAATKKHAKDSFVKRHLPKEADLYMSGSVWFLEVYNGRHNSLPNFQVVIDTMYAWIVQNKI